MKTEKNQSKIFVVGFSIIFLIVVGFFLKPLLTDWKNNQKESEEKRANEEILKAPSIMPEDLAKLLKENSKIFLLDISSETDFKKGHITNSYNLSSEKLSDDYFKKIGAGKTSSIFVINNGENLANLAAATNKIISLGFVNAKYLRGGIIGWKEKGYPLVSFGGSKEDIAKVKKISISEIKEDSETDDGIFQFVDVRSEKYFSAERIVGAINIPVEEIEKRNNEISALKKVIVYGDSEEDSFQAAVSLFDLNFFNIYQLDGTLENWKEAGGNVDK